MKIGYIVHNLNDPAVERRCIMLERGGASVTLSGFCRDSAVAEAVLQRSPFILGQSKDAAMVERAITTMKVAASSKKLNDWLADCDVIIARNLEQLGIACRIVGHRPLVYECLDIHRSLVGQSIPAKLVQLVEAKLLPRVDMLLTSSPAFLREHFEHRPLAAPAHLIENKLLVLDGAAPQRLPAIPSLPFRIGWFGMLRCKRTFAFLAELVRRSEGRIEVLICGKPSPAELPDFAENVERLPGMQFTGPYSYDDLPHLYGQCHFAWTIDWFEEGLNSSWLLPNRLYEALCHGAIPIALADIELGRWLTAHNAGLRVANPEEAMQRLLHLSEQDVTDMQKLVLNVDQDILLADSSDCRNLVQLIDTARHS